MKTLIILENTLADSIGPIHVRKDGSATIGFGPTFPTVDALEDAYEMAVFLDGEDLGAAIVDVIDDLESDGVRHTPSAYVVAYLRTRRVAASNEAIVGANHYLTGVTR